MNIIEEYKKSLKMREVEELLDLILYRPLALVFVRVIYRTPITPNAVTFLSFVSGLCAAWCFAQGTAYGFAWGGIWYAIANILDCSDGQLARLQGSGTPLGRLVDGVVDWAISVAIFVGCGIGMTTATGDARMWYLASVGGITSAVHAFFFDLYQQQFIATIRGERNFVDREIDKISVELTKLNGDSALSVRRAFLLLYLRYLRAQQRSRPAETEQSYPPELYRSMNKTLMRFWTLLGPTTNRSLLIVAGLLNQLVSVFFWPVITVGNALLIVALIWQGRVSGKLQKAMAQQNAPILHKTSATA